jgi:hypothetical protein
MNSIASFFAGIIAFVSSLFGHQVVQTPNSTTFVERSATTTIEDQIIEIRPTREFEFGYNSVYRYYKDARHVYIESYGKKEIIEGADSESFSLDVALASTTNYNYYLEFSKDKNHIYYRGKLTPFTQNFMLIDPGMNKSCGSAAYVLDMTENKKTVFVATFDKNYNATFVELKNADPTSFRVLRTGYSKDKNNVYLGATSTNDDPKSFDLQNAYDACPVG